MAQSFATHFRTASPQERPVLRKLSHDWLLRAEELLDREQAKEARE
jgi:hypothetical protein